MKGLTRLCYYNQNYLWNININCRYERQGQQSISEYPVKSMRKWYIWKLLHEMFPIPIPMCVPQRILVNFYCVLTMQQVLKKNDKGKGGVGKCTESRPRVRILLCWCYCTVL